MDPNIPTPTDARVPPRVVVAEDDEDIRMVIAVGLRCDGHEVIEVPNGLALLDFVRSALDGGRLPDLIISDLRMPGVSGLRALAALRRAHCNVPVLLVTAYGEEKARAEAARLGVDAFIDKPFDLCDLRLMASRIVGGHSTHPPR